jgi:hypothetical protein
MAKAEAVESRKTPNGLTEAQLFEQLNQPFAVDDIKWKPQTVDYKKKTAMAVAHADPRAYIDRLNETVGIGGWSSSYSFVVTPFTKFIKGKAAYKDRPATEDKLIAGNRVLCVCVVTVDGIGSHSSTGESDASDENSATGAEAQAFKRACMQFGLGRYLYDLPKVVVSYDLDRGGFQGVPTLPDWAIPKIFCKDCANQIQAAKHGETEYNISQLVNNSEKKYGAKLCIDCQRKRAEATKTASGGRL